MKTLWLVTPAVVAWSAVAQAVPVTGASLDPPEAQGEPVIVPVQHTAPAVPVSEPPPVDQGPDTLPALEDPPAAPAPEPARAPATASVPPVVLSRSMQPIRAERRLALLGEIGWNSLAGLGPNLTFHAHPHLSFDLGAGFALVGAKLGLRTRYNLLKSAVTPFVGVGVLVASGFDAPSRDPARQDDNPELNVKVLPSAFVQAVAGVDWTSRDGFTLIGALGYAWLVGGDNVQIITGEPTPEENRGLDIAFRSSAVVSIAIGYSFR